MAVEYLPAKSRRGNLGYANEIQLAGGAVVVHSAPAPSANTPIQDFAKSLTGVLNGPDDGVHRLAFEEDPGIHTIYGGIYRPKSRLVPDSLLKRISIQDSLVATIVRIRQNQMSAFGRPRPDRFSTGYVIRPNPETLENLDSKEKAELNKRIGAAVKRFQTCGDTAGVPQHRRRSFTQWLSDSTRSAVVCGRIATEAVGVTSGGVKRFHHFQAVDGGTIYHSALDNEAAKSVRENAYGLLEQVLNIKSSAEKKRFEQQFGDEDGWVRGDYVWVQVVNGKPVQAFTTDELKVANFYSVPDVEMAGYPVTPIDTVLNSIMTHLDIGSHNRLYFQSGRATKGMLVIKSEDATPQSIAVIKQQFNNSINSVSNCVSGNTFISTQDIGGSSIADFLNGAEQRRGTVWTPYGWQPGLVYRTGRKFLVETEISNGVVHETSPDHRFRVIDAEGDQAWKRQEALVSGDTVLVNRRPVDANGATPVVMGAEMTADLVEVLGWMTGDGSLTNRGIGLYYNSETEEDLRDHHLDVLAAAGWGGARVDYERTPEEQDEICIRYGFKSCASRVIGIDVNSVVLSRALVDAGFTLSARGVDVVGKSIPGWLFTAPTALRIAFLRGLFSADGNNAKRRNPALTCCNHRLRAQVRLLLLSLGIRTTHSEGRTKQIVSGGKTEGKSLLRIKDRDAFFELIGFVQEHKQPLAVQNRNRAAMQDKVPQALALKFVRMAKTAGRDVLSKRQQMDLDELLRGDRAVSRPRLERICSTTGVKLPDWFADFHFEQVVATRRTDREIEMFDVSIYEPTHECHGAHCKAPQHSFFGDFTDLANSWRMPVFSVGADESVDWKPIDAGGGRDMEFQYLSDMNAREIMSAFQMSPDELVAWSYLSKGTNSQSLSECFHPGSTIITAEGARQAGDVIGDAEERRFRTWTGTAWVDARIFRSGEKPLVETELDCGVVNKTSPIHRFRVLTAGGDAGWKRQEELVPGDSVLLPRQPTAAALPAPEFRGRQATPEMLEILGWIAGDGSLVPPKPRSGARITLFYHPEKEQDVWRAQYEYLKSWGVNVHQKREEISEEERVAIKAERGFKECASFRITNVIYDTEFYRWLETMGFTPSSRGEVGKSVPEVLHVMPIELRRAFLRGLFSADGGKVNDRGSVALTIQNTRLREQVRRLLLGVGVRTLGCKGLMRNGIGAGKKRRKAFSYKLFVKDRQVFWDTVGFIQPHKQLDRVAQQWQIGNPPKEMTIRYFAACMATAVYAELPKTRRDAIATIVNDRHNRKCSWQFFESVLQACGVPAPEWMADFYAEPIRAIRQTDERVQMLDVEVFDDAHAFILDGVVTHNSNGEYKLEAARDVGIRPLMQSFEAFINDSLFPLIDPELAKQCRFTFVGLDAEDEEKEAVNLANTAKLYHTYDDILEKVEKPPVGRKMGGGFPLNPDYQAAIAPYLTVGEILEFFFDRTDASKDPALAYRRDPFAQAQQQMQAQMQAAQQPPPGGSPGGGPQGPQQGPPEQGQPEQGQPQQGDTAAGQLARSVDAALAALGKSEAQLPPGKRLLLAQQDATVRAFMRGWETDAEEATRGIEGIARQLTGNRKRRPSQS